MTSDLVQRSQQVIKDAKSNIASFFSTLNWFNSIAITLLGVTMTLAYAPYNVWFLPFIVFPIFFIAIDAVKSNKQATIYGFLFGLGWFGAGISWVHVAISEFGGLPLILSIILMLILCSYLALYPALFAWLFKNFKARKNLTLLILMWLFVEFLRSWMLTGFPWLSIGYTQTFSIFSSFAPIIGEFGLQALVIGLSAAIVFNKYRWVILSTVLLITIWGHSLNWSEQPSRTVKIALVQGNVEQSVKWNPDNEVPTMNKYWRLTEPYLAQADIIIWPEAAIPRIEYLAHEYLQFIDQQAFEHNSAIVTGIVEYHPDLETAYNSVLSVGKKRSNDKLGQYYYGHSNRYQKHHLLPIGEFVPFESIMRTLAPLFNLPMSSFNRGNYRQENLIANDLYMATAICFEIAFPNQLRANINNKTDVLLTVSNDAWFGNSHGPWQHLQIAQMRALEFAKPVIRVTNNGVTGLINQFGNTSAQLPQNQADTLITELSIAKSETWYQKLGNFPIIVILMSFYLVGIIKEKA